jgi:hypothetical protein
MLPHFVTFCSRCKLECPRFARPRSPRRSWDGWTARAHPLCMVTPIIAFVHPSRESGNHRALTFALLSSNFVCRFVFCADLSAGCVGATSLCIYGAQRSIFSLNWDNNTVSSFFTLTFASPLCAYPMSVCRWNGWTLQRFAASST